jgi:hypothetical protein
VYPISATLGTVCISFFLFILILYSKSLSIYLRTFAIRSSINLLYICNSLSPDPLIFPKALLYLADTTSINTSFACIKSPLNIDDNEANALPLLTNLVFANFKNANSIYNLATP